jgi:hypothetical protein
MPNPTGRNQIMRSEPGYGDIKKQTQLQREAPMSGAPTPAVNAPRRAQRKAVRAAKTAQPPQPTVLERPDTFQPDTAPHVQELLGDTSSAPPPDVVQFWQDAAQLPGASPLVQEYAARAQQGG